jgi:hypothetical protein
MNIHAYQQLQAQRGQLAGILAAMPSEQVIDRLSLESRIKWLDESLGTVQQPTRLPARAKLTFRGKPVVGSYGVFAEFGAKAVDGFADAIATLAASLEGPLGARGTLPNRENYRMLITGTAIGSFGFELEEHIQGDTLPFAEASPVEEALEQTKTILRATQGTDEDLAEAISGTDPRALAVLREFIETLAAGEAVCSIEFGAEPFRFADVGAVRRCEQRLSQDTIHEEEQTIDGTFQGVLPHRRSFEFKVAGSGEILSGKVGGSIENAGEINRVLDRPVQIAVLATRVGNGRPRYRLLNYENVNTGE